MNYHRTSDVSSPIYEMERQGSTLQARKAASTGGNRSWSEEEENYLLQTRSQKMPYKHIAAHLKKTELACRLHYHQLSHGSHRRKRTSSISSSVSSGSIGHSPCQYQLPTVDFSRRPVLEQPRQMTPPSNYSPINSTAQSPISRTQHKVILPKPQPRLLTPQSSPEPTLNALRIHNINVSPTGSAPISAQSSVDTDRLRSIYEARRQQFWAAVAADYGPDVSPAQLEDIWRHGSAHTAGIRPFTPPEDLNSPDSAISGMGKPMLLPSPFPSVNSISYDRATIILPAPNQLPATRPSRSSTVSSTTSSSGAPATSIAALLTEDREPRDSAMRD